jgi:hypothetical protein
LQLNFYHLPKLSTLCGCRFCFLLFGFLRSSFISFVVIRRVCLEMSYCTSLHTLQQENSCC